MAEELKFEIGEPIPNTFDYSLTPEELDKQLAERVEKVKRGAVKGTQELSLLGFALDFVDFAKQDMDVSLSFAEEDLANFDGIISAMRSRFIEDPPPQEFFEGFVKMSVGFFGVMVIKNLGGSWGESALGITLICNGKSAFIFSRMAQFLNGGNDSMTALYNALKVPEDQ